jgi:signal transduction histidine kinase/DNA-binding response OmpR family regulator
MRTQDPTESSDGTIFARTHEILRDNERQLREHTDYMFVYLMILQWLAGIVAAVWVSPRAWVGQTSHIHVHVWAALFLGGGIVSLPIFLALTHPGRALTRHAIAAAQMLNAALLIHFTGGRVETHFQIFGLLAFLAFYRDWKVIVTATLLTAADHMIRGMLWPQSIYGVLTADSLRWVEHAGWVLFESGFLLWAIRTNRREMFGIAQQRAELEANKASVERKVAKRTLQLTEELAVRRRQEEELARTRDAALEAARLKAEFLANMSHEIRTPMNGVIGMTGLLLDTELTTEQRESVEIIRSCGDSLLTLINDILDFSKIEAGKLTFEILDFDIRETTEGVVEMLAERAQSKNLELICHLQEDVPSALRGDPGRLRQVLMNLIGNALKFTEKGEVIVTAALHSQTESDVVVRFAVQDSGIGISAQGCQNLFQAFTQADGSTTRKYGGTGLGLAISKRIVEMMGGQIGVQSTPGAGSTFFFTARFEKQLPATLARPRPLAKLSGSRVLIVDDNEINRLVVQLQLKSSGIATMEARDAAEALRLLAKERDAGRSFDLILLDMQMPGMDGLELAQRIHADPTLSAHRMIMMTSLGSYHREFEAQLRAAGVSLCLTKPVKQFKLFDSIARVLSSPGTPAKQEAAAKDLPPVRSARNGAESRADTPASLAHILVAEDNPINQKVILRQLSKLGYRADAVTNGLEVLAALEQIRYDLLLLDCQMPEMDGYTAARELRRREQGSLHIPIIALTAHTMQGDREKCLAAGMDDYLSKPVKTEELEQKLDRWLTQKNAGAHKNKETLPAELIDMAVLQKSADGDPVFMREMLDLYLSEGSRQIAALRTAVHASALSDVEKLAHSLVGSSMTFGMRTMVSPLRQLEEMARKGQLRDGERCLDTVAEQFEHIQTFLATAPLAAAA